MYIIIIIISESRVVDASTRRKTKNTHQTVFNVAICTYSIISVLRTSEEEWQRYGAACPLKPPVWEDEACELSASYVICQYLERATVLNTASNG